MSTELDKIIAEVDDALAAKSRGELDPAQIALSRALVSLPKEHHYYPTCLAELAEIEEYKEDWLRAIQHNLTLMIDLESRLGERDPITIATMSKTANLFARIGLDDESATLSERARTLTERVLAEQSGLTLAPTTSEHSELIQNWDNEMSMALLAAFENAYAPQLKGVDSGDSSTPKQNLRSRLATLSEEADAKAEEIEAAPPTTRITAGLKNMRDPLSKRFAELLDDRRTVPYALLASGPILILGVVMFLSQIKHSSMEQLYQNISHKFVSADGQKIITMGNMYECEVVIDSHQEKIPYRFYAGGLTDSLDLSFAPIMQKQYWIKRISDKCVDEAGGSLYPDTSPEMRTVNSINLITRGAAAYFLKEHSYPEHFDRLQKELEDQDNHKYFFINAYDGKPLNPTIIPISYKAPDEQSGDGWRQNLLLKMRTGQPVENEPAFEPGAVRCYLVALEMKRGVVQEFLVRGFDKNGKVIGGNTEGSGFYMGLEDGQPLKTDKQPFYFDTNLILRPRMIWIIDIPLAGLLEWLMHNLGMLTALFSSLAMLVTALYMSKRSMWQPPLYLLSAIGFIVTAIYFFSPALP